MSHSKHLVYPFRTIEYSKKYHQVQKFKDYVGFYCKSCFNPMIYRASITINLQHIDKEETASIFLQPHYELECPKCHHINQYDECLDPNITPMIAELNRKGYATVFCCEGHKVNQDSHSLPYIRFKYNGQKRVIDYVPLVGPWKLDGDYETLIGDDGVEYRQYIGNRFTIRCDNLDMPIRERMAYLRRWVNALPYCFEEEFTPEMMTEDTRNALAYMNSPLAEEDITYDNQDDVEEDDCFTIEKASPTDKLGKRTYSTHNEIKGKEPDVPPIVQKINAIKKPYVNKYNKRGGYNGHSRQPIKTGTYTNNYKPKQEPAPVAVEHRARKSTKRYIQNNDNQ